MRHPNAHPSLRLASAMTGATLLLAMVAPAAHAGWSGTTIEPSWFLTRPSLRVDDADHQRIAYQRSGDEPGILFTSDATGSWIDERVTSGPDYAPALAIDGGGHDQIVFARLGDAPGVYQTDDATGSWSAPTLIAADLDPGEVSIAIDGAGKLHVAYASDYSFAPGVYYVTNATGSWVRTRITSGTYDAHASLALDAVGHVHVAFARLAPEAPGVYVTTNAAGPWVAAVDRRRRPPPRHLLEDRGRLGGDLLRHRCDRALGHGQAAVRRRVGLWPGGLRDRWRWHGPHLRGPAAPRARVLELRWPDALGVREWRLGRR